MTGGPAGRAQVGGREAAFLAAGDVFSGRGFAADRLGALRAAGQIEQREAALATQIALGAVRHTITLDHVLAAVARYDPRRLRAPLRAILHTAAQQIIWMDRVPVFAAVDEAVSLARKHVGSRAAGMANAVLRKLADAIDQRLAGWERLNPRHVRVNWQQACTFTKEVLPPPQSASGELVHLAAATGERVRRYHALARRFGPAQAEALAWASQAVPSTTLRRHRLRINAGVFQEQVRSSCGEVAECAADAAYLPAAVDVAALPLLRDGRAYVQDDTAHAAATLVEPRPGERVLDLCAAPGGKSIVLAQAMHDRGEVIACDASPERILRVRANLTRLKLTCVRTHLVRTSDASEADLAGAFDAALVDVPCSNTGVLARRPEARLGLTRCKLSSLVELQGALLRHAAARVRPGGRLVYSTCSIEPEENQQLVAAFLAENAGWRLDVQKTWLPAWGARLCDWRDGGYAARLVHARRQPVEKRSARQFSVVPDLRVRRSGAATGGAPDCEVRRCGFSTDC